MVCCDGEGNENDVMLNGEGRRFLQMNRCQNFTSPFQGELTFQPDASAGNPMIALGTGFHKHPLVANFTSVLEAPTH